MRTAKMTIRLPQDELTFAKHYAREHGFSLTALMRRYLGRLLVESDDVPVEVRDVAGIVPSRVDAKAEYREHAIRKHR